MQESHINNNEQILVAGYGKLAYCVVVCLLQAGHPVVLYTDYKEEAKRRIGIHLNDLKEQKCHVPEPIDLQITENFENRISNKLAIIITGEREDKKKRLIKELEQRSSPETIIAINTESISLETLQQHSRVPEKIIGLNWTEPAHTTSFLEIISNDIVDQKYIDDLLYLAKKYWSKDPYVVSGNYGIRSKMISAMAREAFYLVENGYASVEDIDRACRNDAGYYLPFAGNCRYMDLMGTYIYGIVMKDLNPDLDQDKKIPVFFDDILEKGGKGMENGNGFYPYKDEDVKKWDDTFRKFSYQIKQLMDKYPFSY